MNTIQILIFRFIFNNKSNLNWAQFDLYYLYNYKYIVFLVRIANKSIFTILILYPLILLVIISVIIKSR
jgi:hypothetical protein